MASNIIHCEVVAKTYREPSSVQFDEENNWIYILTNYRLSLLNLNNNFHVELVRQRKRKNKKMIMKMNILKVTLMKIES